MLKSALLIIMVLLISACSEDFLNKEPNQSVSTEKALVTFGDFKAAILGVHDAISSSNYYGRYFVLVNDIMSDDVKQNASANRASDWADYTGSSTDNNNLAENIWQQGYIAINRANRIILTEANLPAGVQEEYNHILGQAYALRAMVHFDMVRIYGQHYTYTADASHLGVPYVKSVDPFLKPVRNTVAEVYSMALDDFNTALGLLGESESASFISYLGVKALMSRVYLYMEDYPNCIAMANDVIGSGKYSLVPNEEYMDIFTLDNNSEAIFEVDFRENDSRGTDCLGGMYNVSGYGDYLPSMDLVNLIPAGDAREEVVTDAPDLPGGDYGNLRVAKFPHPLGYDNISVIRLSEVYLNRAEAYYFTAGREDDARADCDLIRQRGLPTAPDITATGTVLLDEILLERRIELCFEGQRLWNLTRHKMGVTRNNCTSQTCTIGYPSERFVLAIGQYEIDVNSNIIQNPGY